MGSSVTTCATAERGARLSQLLELRETLSDTGREDLKRIRQAASA